MPTTLSQALARDNFDTPNDFLSLGDYDANRRKLFLSFDVRKGWSILRLSAIDRLIRKYTFTLANRIPFLCYLRNTHWDHIVKHQKDLLGNLCANQSIQHALNLRAQQLYKKSIQYNPETLVSFSEDSIQENPLDILKTTSPMRSDRRHSVITNNWAPPKLQDIPETPHAIPLMYLLFNARKFRHLAVSSSSLPIQNLIQAYKAEPQAQFPFGERNAFASSMAHKLLEEIQSQPPEHTSTSINVEDPLHLCLSLLKLINSPIPLEKQTLTCSSPLNTQPFSTHFISVPLHKPTLQENLNQYFAWQEQPHQALTRIQPATPLPELLLVHVERFDSFWTKDPRSLSLHSHLTLPNIPEPSTYKIRGIILHEGKKFSPPQYVTVIEQQNTWYRITPNQIHKTHPQYIDPAQAYFILLERDDSLSIPPFPIGKQRMEEHERYEKHTPPNYAYHQEKWATALLIHALIKFSSVQTLIKTQNRKSHPSPFLQTANKLLTTQTPELFRKHLSHAISQCYLKPQEVYTQRVPFADILTQFKIPPIQTHHNPSLTSLELTQGDLHEFLNGWKRGQQFRYSPDVLPIFCTSSDNTVDLSKPIDLSAMIPLVDASDDFPLSSSISSSLSSPRSLLYRTRSCILHNKNLIQYKRGLYYHLTPKATKQISPQTISGACFILLERIR